MPWLVPWHFIYYLNLRTSHRRGLSQIWRPFMKLRWDKIRVLIPIFFLELMECDRIYQTSISLGVINIDRHCDGTGIEHHFNIIQSTFYPLPCCPGLSRTYLVCGLATSGKIVADVGFTTSGTYSDCFLNSDRENPRSNPSNYINTRYEMVPELRMTYLQPYLYHGHGLVAWVDFWG